MRLFEIRFFSSHHLAREFDVRISHWSRNWHGIDYSRRKHTSVSTPLVSDQIVYSTFIACYLSFIHYISIIPFYPFIVLPPRCCMLRQFLYEVPTEPAHDIVIHPSPHVGMTQQWTSRKNSATAVDSCARGVCFQAGLVYCVVFTEWYCSRVDACMTALATNEVRMHWSIVAPWTCTRNMNKGNFVYSSREHLVFGARVMVIYKTDLWMPYNRCKTHTIVDCKDMVKTTNKCQVFL